MDEVTDGADMRARRSRSWRRRWPVRTVSVTVVPGRPRISPVETRLDLPASERPFTATISSPRRIPARAAGERGNTRDTLRPAWTSATSMPTPEKRPRVASSKRA